MKIKIISSTMVKPMVSKASTALWLSNLDLVLLPNYHVRLAILYHWTAGSAEFFDSSVLKAALSRALVVFYPLAGRLSTKKERYEINCNGEGAMFFEAESDSRVDEFCGIGEHNLSPPVDYSGGVSTVPLLLIQVTRFKCGGVCLGVAIDHLLADGVSTYHFLRTWGEIARGVDISLVPYMDRHVLSARRPPRVEFTHLEYQTPPALKMKSSTSTSTKTITSTFRITRQQLNALKDKCNHQAHGVTNYNTFVVLAAHVWRCATKARALPEDQETRLFFPTDGRSRMQLPRGYFGNVVITATCSASCRDLVSKDLEFAARKIYEAIARMDDNYLRSVIDSLELQMPAAGTNFWESPNFTITTWDRFRVDKLDFGWGKPIFLGYCGIIQEGITFVFPSPTNDGSMLYTIALPKEQMQVFEHLLYQGLQKTKLYSSSL